VTVFNRVIFHSWINILLVFVPVGIAVNFVPNMSPGVIFAMNAIAIIPLAGLLSHATETVAHRMGDAIGALLNITFGNAVELIILYVLALKPMPGDGLDLGACGSLSGTEAVNP
jgi:Ca2+:H+ antiporter